MRTLTWRMGCVAVALAALVSYPGVSFGQDCTYGGATTNLTFNPANHSCVASGSVKTIKSLNIPPDLPLEIAAAGTGIHVNGFFPIGFFLPGTFRLGKALVFSSLETLGDISISAGGEFRNDAGVLFLIAPLDAIRLKGRARVILNGDPAALDPSTLLWGDYVRIESANGNIDMTNTTVFTTQGGMDFVAPKGDIIMHDTTLFSIQNAGNTIGECRFQPKVAMHVQIGQVIGLNDPGNTIVCIPKIKL